MAEAEYRAPCGSVGLEAFGVTRYLSRSAMSAVAISLDNEIEVLKVEVNPEAVEVETRAWLGEAGLQRDSPEALLENRVGQSEGASVN